jgi:hypothetical protein
MTQTRLESNIIKDFLGSRGVVAEVSVLLGQDAASRSNWILTFSRNVLPSSSGGNKSLIFQYVSTLEDECST